MYRTSITMLLSLGLAACGRGRAAAPRAGDAVAVRIAPVSVDRIAPPVTATGTLGPKEEVTLSFKLGGVVSRIFVDEGRAVRAGDTLAELDLSEIDAGVVWYGCPPLEYIDAAKIRAPLQGHWATQDEFFPIATIDSLQGKLREAGVTFDFHRYLARHAFANETAVGPGRIPQTQYDPVWSQQAWDRTFSFFSRWLR